MSNGALGLNPDDLARAILSLAGEPELVIVDARTLRLLMGDLAALIILKKFELGPGHLAVGEEKFVWDEPEPGKTTLCPDFCRCC